MNSIGANFYPNSFRFLNGVDFEPKNRRKSKHTIVGRIIFWGLLYCFTSDVLAQKTYWASKIEGTSTEYVATNQQQEYRASQVLGKPNVLPQSVSSFCAWRASTPENPNEEWIKVSFDTLMSVRQIAIAENYGQGCVSKVLLYDENQKEHVVYETNTPKKEIGVGKMMNVVLDTISPYKVSAVKIELITAWIKGWNEIDAIGISTSKKPIEALINVSKALAQNMTIAKEQIEGVNSKWRDVAPVIAPDGKALYITRFGHPENIGYNKNATRNKEDQDVWVSQHLNGVWQLAENLGEPINNADNNALQSISTDGRSAYLINVYRPDGTMTKGISVSHKKRTGWTFPKEMKIKDFYNLSDWHEFTIGPGGTIMVMSVQDKVSIGNRDLYVSFMLKDSSWTKPKHLGKTLNTAGTEGSPFLAMDGKTLYFSSNGHSGYGSSDIFLSRRLDETWTRWSEPENLGPVVNTPQWDGYFTIPASGDLAYMVSLDEKTKDEDIYRIKLVPEIKPEAVSVLSGQVLDYATKRPITATVSVETLADTAKTMNEIAYDPATGDYKMIIPLRNSYSVLAKKANYLSLAETLDLSKEKTYREIKKNLYVVPLIAGQKIILNNVFFEQSKFDLLPISYPELDRIVILMKDNPNLHIMLEGHTDNQGDFQLNLKLSQDRVNEVKKYMVEIGKTESIRIETKGWGATKPISSNVTEEKRKLNRRVEFTIVKN